MACPAPPLYTTPVQTPTHLNEWESSLTFWQFRGHGPELAVVVPMYVCSGTLRMCWAE